MENNRDWEISSSQEGIKGKTIQDFLYFEGMFNPVLRFSFTNVLDRTFTSKWNGNPYNVASGVTVKLPHYLAVKFTKEIVDALMQADNKSSSMAIPAMRKPYEDKVLRMLPTEQSTELEVLKSDFIDQVKRDSERPTGEPDSQSPAASLDLNFEDLRPRITGITAPSEPQPAPKRGRPKKSQ